MVRNPIGSVTSAAANLIVREPPSLTGKWTLKGFQFVTDEGAPYVRDGTIPLNLVQVDASHIQVTTPADPRVRLDFYLDDGEWQCDMSGYDQDHDFRDGYLRMRLLADDWGVAFVGNTFLKIPPGGIWTLLIPILD